MDSGDLYGAVLVVCGQYCLYTAVHEGDQLVHHVHHVHPVAAGENSARMLNDAFFVLMCPEYDQLSVLVQDWQLGQVQAQYESSSGDKMALASP